jgi:hypothetical protein
LPTDGADGPDGVQLEQPCLSGLATDRGVDNPRDNWLVLHATEAGVYRIGAPYKMPRGSACAS